MGHVACLLGGLVHVGLVHEGQVLPLLLSDGDGGAATHHLGGAVRDLAKKVEVSQGRMLTTEDVWRGGGSAYLLDWLGLGLLLFLLLLLGLLLLREGVGQGAEDGLAGGRGRLGLGLLLLLWLRLGLRGLSVTHSLKELEKRREGREERSLPWV